MFDWKSQEYGIWAGLSEDERQIEDFCSGDPYMAFARNAGLPGDLGLRDRYKVICLGIPYGMTEFGVAKKLGVTHTDARMLLERHRDTYLPAWR